MGYYVGVIMKMYVKHEIFEHDWGGNILIGLFYSAIWGMAYGWSGVDGWELRHFQINCVILLFFASFFGVIASLFYYLRLFPFTSYTTRCATASLKPFVEIIFKKTKQKRATPKSYSFFKYRLAKSYSHRERFPNYHRR
ncbi:hypothetical protein CN378_15885 [Bacillus sp. AFS015802]|nr:hypothetical protein CN378_15885 [Bacillus sp. AFS015802]